MRLSLFVILLVFCASAANARIIQGEEHWQGEVRINESIRVEKNARLIIGPGTHVVATAEIEISGVIQATGAEFSGLDWPGLVLKGTGAETRLVNCRFQGAKTALTIIGGEPQLKGLTFEKNRIGLEIRQKSRALVENSLFRNNSRVGLFLKDGSLATIKGNRFEQQGTFGAYIYRAKPAVFTENHFVDNPTGLMISHFGSDPIIQKNYFSKNKVGILVDRTASPKIQHNLFSDNETALKLYRRSDPLVERNLFKQNRQAVHISFSSYPQIHFNDFLANDKAVILEFQSSTWEAQKGAEARQEQISGQGAFGGQKQEQVTEDQRRARNHDGSVDARQNWWGPKETLELLNQTQETNPSWILDGQDNPLFEEGGQEFPLDHVQWLPFGRKPYTAEALP